MENNPVFAEHLTAYPVFYRTYSRKTQDSRENWGDVCKRTTLGLVELGQLSLSEADLIFQQQKELKALTSGRYLWVGGTEWSKQPDNFPGVYNCSCTNVDSWDAFALIMDVTMMGCGAGAVVEEKYIGKLPTIINKIKFEISRDIGLVNASERQELSTIEVEGNKVVITVGDSRKGWVESYRMLLELSSDERFSQYNNGINLEIDFGHVRPAGEPLKGFGGISNPIKLIDTFASCVKVLNRANGRKLNSVECCLLIDHAALAIVAGNVRRSAGIKLAGKDDNVFAVAKDNLWQQDEHGNWRIDPERDALRMSNHTRVFHKKPTKQECIDAVRKQYYSGEGAIEWAGEAVVRANADVPLEKRLMLKAYEKGDLAQWIQLTMSLPEKEIEHRIARYGLNPCLAADNWVLTSDGPRTVFSLVGEQFETIIHGKPVLSDGRGFWVSGIKEVYHLLTEEGFSIRLTDNHKLQKADGEWVEVNDLRPGDKLALHNHSGYFNAECFNWLADNFFKTRGLTVGMEVPIVFTSSRDHLKNVQRYLLWLGVFSSIEGSDGKNKYNLVIRGENQEILRKLISYYFHEDEKDLTPISRNTIATVKSIIHDGQETVYDCSIPNYHYLDCNGFVTHNCGEILLNNNFCNLSEVHLNMIDPYDYHAQEKAFRAAGLSVAILLNHKFVPERYQYSREIDPIVGVSFTGLFDFFVNRFGVQWLEWWQEGRPNNERGREFKQIEQEYLTRWKKIVFDTIFDYCDRHNLRRPNRCTTVQPSGSKSLLTGASPGWHPPKAQRYIRRITFRRDDPVALACIDFGYNVIPSQSDKDENGHLLNDPFDPRCTEWLVEIPVEMPWANLPGADQIDIHEFSVLAQFDFAMQVQQYYVTHNTSSTLEFRESEIELLGERIYQAIRDDEGYVSAALLARFDDNQTFPRLPFEPIDKATYERLHNEMITRRKVDDFHDALRKYDFGEMFDQGPAPCDSDKCLIGNSR